MSDTKPYILFHAKGYGSVFTQAILRLFDIPHELVEFSYEETTKKEGPNYARLVEANPLAQFPTLITPEGYVMTEMTAIALYLQHQHGKGTQWDISLLAPSQLAAFYRWFIFIPANLFPTLTVGNYPSRFVQVPTDSPVNSKTVEEWISKGTMGRREEMWRIMERDMTSELGNGIFLLGTAHPSFLDVLVALLAHWTPWPRYSWLEENCPKLANNVRAVLRVDVIRDVFEENDLRDFLEV